MGRNLGDIKIGDLQRKVIIIVDKSNPSMKALTWTNMSIWQVIRCLQAMRYDQMKFTPDMKELIEFNKRQMSVMPDLSAYDANPIGIGFKYGCK